jgi:hypothetical protein
MADPIKAAKGIFDQFLSKADPGAIHHTETRDQQTKDAGRKISAKGGTARAESLTPKKRRQIAKRAAKARWSKS